MPETVTELLNSVFEAVLAEVVMSIDVAPEHLENEKELVSKLFNLVAKKTRLVPKTIIAGKELTDATRNHQVCVCVCVCVMCVNACTKGGRRGCHHPTFYT